uniref:AGC-kinase C-terminal domain-containing protein n=1 Tax=Cyclopterus lumpus TaxID=8103 RepID=A0A8C2XB46_CYCLU
MPFTFQTIDWEALLAKKATPPFLPSIKESLDVGNFDSEFTRLQPIMSPPSKPFVLSAEQQDAFADFDFCALYGRRSSCGGRSPPASSSTSVGE